MSSHNSNYIVIIPARLESVRLPNKPLADINGKPLIVRVYENVAQFLNKDNVYVAAGDASIAKAITDAGGKAILTDPELPSGTDRVFAALKTLTQQGINYDYVVNFQGDSVNVDPNIITKLIKLAEDTGADVTTPAMLIKDNEAIKADHSCVKAIIGVKEGDHCGQAYYFTRACAPYTQGSKTINDGPIYHHVGVYCYKMEALKKFVELPQGILEQREKLEQLRAIENGFKIWVEVVDNIKLVQAAPADVDVKEELELAKRYLF